jgi:hypothetical protein
MSDSIKPDRVKKLHSITAYLQKVFEEKYPKGTSDQWFAFLDGALAKIDFDIERIND